MPNISLFQHGRITEPIQQLLDQLYEFERLHNRPPLVKELLMLAGVATTTTRSRIDRMMEMHLVEYPPSLAGNGGMQFIRLTERGHQAQRTGWVPHPIPLYESGVHAGSRGVEMEHQARWISCLSDIFHITDPKMFYFLPIVGDCMDGGRRPLPAGSICLFERCNRWNRPANGRAVHVEVTIGNSGTTEALLRDYEYDEGLGLVTLTPRNPDFEPEEHSDAEVDPRGVLVQTVITEDHNRTLFERACEASSYVLPMRIGAHR
jgi:hypothetical protein